MIHIKCTLGVCGECPEYKITDEYIYDVPNDSFKRFSIYNYQRRCATDGITSNRPRLCRIIIIIIIITIIATIKGSAPLLNS